MRAIALICVLGAGCLDNPSVTVGDVITRLAPTGDPTTWVADGATPITVEICTAASSDLDPKLTATLKASAGAWQLHDADASTATVTLSESCERRALVPDNRPSTIAIGATLGTFFLQTELTLRPACVEGVRLSRQGSLSTTDASMLTIGALLDVASAVGKPSLGTTVNFSVTVDAPAGATASFSQAQTTVAAGADIQSALFVGKGVTKLTVTATAATVNCPARAADPLVIVQ
jgi:hypothetical protein